MQDGEKPVSSGELIHLATGRAGERGREDDGKEGRGVAAFQRVPGYGVPSGHGRSWQSGLYRAAHASRSRWAAAMSQPRCPTSPTEETRANPCSRGKPGFPLPAKYPLFPAYGCLGARGSVCSESRVQPLHVSDDCLQALPGTATNTAQWSDRAPSYSDAVTFTCVTHGDWAFFTTHGPRSCSLAAGLF